MCNPKTKYRVRKTFFGKSILQRWACFPSGISSPLAGTCDWIDVPYNKAPTELREVTNDDR